jgi:pimeloyl-ACP methyl ester carboxylesterase
MAKSADGMRTSTIHYRFLTPAFAFVFQWVLGVGTNGGSEVGECFYAASQVKENDPESWVRAFSSMAESLKNKAEGSFKDGRLVSARECYLRAYTYFRAAFTFLSPFEKERVMPLWREAVACFQRAAELFDPHIEPIHIACDECFLPGYFLGHKGQGKAKTVILIGGADTYVEDLYLFLGPSALKRGYNLLFVDLPGQGGLPFSGSYMQPNTEDPFKKVVDYAVCRPEVDAERIAAYGISAGGYCVPRALTVERRVRACVACSVISDFYAYMSQNPAALRLAQHPDSLLMKMVMALRKLRPSLVLLDTYAWRWGVKTYADLYEVMKAFTFDPAALTCPILSIIGEKEYQQGPASRLQQTQAVNLNPDKRSKLLITTAADGADAHAMATNMSLMAQLVFDWLDQIVQ